MVAMLLRRSSRTGPLVGAVAVAALGGGLAASGAAGRPRAPRRLWATINVCDPHRARIGIRGQMPGDGTHQRMYMRFIVEYAVAHGWKPLGGDGESPWLPVGSALYGPQQAGWTVTLTRPPAGASYRLRGYVVFEWRRASGRVVRETHAITSAGHPGPFGSPRGFSSGLCRIGGKAKA